MTGIFLIFLVPVWVFIITPEFEKMNSNFYYYEEQIGTNAFAPFRGAELQKSFEHKDTHELKVVSTQGSNLKILSTLTAVNVETDETFLSENRIFDVDSYTRSYKSIEKGYFLFPPNTQQQDYFITFPLAFTHAIFSFQGIDVLEGLEVYLFTCKTDPYDISPAISIFKGDTVKSFYTCKIWIEPVTGRHVNFELMWESYYMENDKVTSLAEKGNKKTSPEFVIKLIEQAKNEKLIYTMYRNVIPFILLISGGTILILTRSSKSRDAQIVVENKNLIQNVEDL